MGFLKRAKDAIITALFTFDRDPSAPFAVTAGSAKVDNFDACKLDGYHRAVSSGYIGGGNVAGSLITSYAVCGFPTGSGYYIPTGLTAAMYFLFSPISGNFWRD